MTGKDDRLYAKFTLDFPDHPKIKPLSDAAFRCLVEATIWSRRQMTDGFLSNRFASASFCFDVLRELCTNDTENPSLIELENGYLIRDFGEHQTTRAEIAERREAKVRAGQKGGIASGRSRREAKAKQTPKQTRSKTKPETETETETDISLTTDVVREAPRTRGTRLPDSWMPAANVVARMRSDHPHIDLKAEHAKFLDYWHAKAGKDARKTDWDATFRNWIRRAAEQHPRAPNGVNGIGKPTQKALGYQTSAERIIAGMEQNP